MLGVSETPGTPELFGRHDRVRVSHSFPVATYIFYHGDLEYLHCKHSPFTMLLL